MFAHSAWRVVLKNRPIAASKLCVLSGAHVVDSCAGGTAGESVVTDGVRLRGEIDSESRPPETLSRLTGGCMHL